MALEKKLSDWIVICLICFSFLSASLAQADHNLIQQGWWEKWVRRKFSKLGLRVVDFFVEYLTAEGSFFGGELVWVKGSTIVK